MLPLLALLSTFCIDGNCRQVERLPAHVEGAESARTFVWIAPDQKKVVLGTVAAHAKRLDAWENAPAHAVSIRLSDEGDAPVTLEFGSAEQRWSFPVRGRALTLVHPRCDCTLEARAAEYRAASGMLADGRATTLLLRRLPAIRGVVIDAATSTPVAGAEVSFEKTSVVTAENGAFRLVVDGDWPRSLRVEHASRAPKVVSVPKTIASVDLPPIRLTAGGTIHLELAPPIGGREAVTWEVRSDDERAAMVRSGRFEVGTASASIEALDPASYLVVIKGSEPLQRFAAKARVLERQTTDVSLAITPIVVEGEVTFDGAPLASPELVVGREDNAWESKFAANEDGRFTEELWQPGGYRISVSRLPYVRLWGTKERVRSDDEHVKLDLAVPNRRLRGRVTEAKTGAPLGDALVLATVKFGEDGAIRLSSRSAADGTYEFNGIETGDASLSARKDGYRFGRPLSFAIGEDETVHEQDVLLEELAVKRTVAVSDARGVPLIGAAVFASGGGAEGYVYVADTDGEGRATLSLASPDDRGVVFVVPRSGSFGFARLTKEPILPIQVQDSASLDLRIESTDGQPIPQVIVLMRVNGIRIPPDVAAQMARIQGLPLYSDASGHLTYPRLPPGQYEIWPVASKADSRDALLPIPPPAPVNVAVLPGPQTVLMKFTPR